MISQMIEWSYQIMCAVHTFLLVDPNLNPNFYAEISNLISILINH